MSKLNVGEKFPDMEVELAYGGRAKLSELVKDDPKSVFWLSRYIGCTLCRYDLKLISDEYEKITAAGAKLYFVLQSKREIVLRDLGDAKTPFDIICDPEMKLYAALDIESAASKEELSAEGNEAEHAKFLDKVKASTEAGFSHGDFEGNELQLPALFAVDQDMKAYYVHYAADSVDMPEVDELVKLI